MQDGVPILAQPKRNKDAPSPLVRILGHDPQIISSPSPGSTRGAGKVMYQQRLREM